MKLIMEQWRKFNEEEGEDEERSELDKIREIFANNGAQAVELGEMLLPDAKEIGMMKRAVRLVREFLELFEKPASYDQRLRARDTFYYDMGRTLMIALPDPIHKGYQGRGPVTTMYHNLGRQMIRVYRVPDIEAAAEWAGVPAPKLPEELKPT